MVQYQEELDRTLAAVADPNRRLLLDRLAGGSATITQLAEAVGVSLTGARKQVGVLERAGLVRSVKRGRSRHCELGPRGLEDLELWVASYRRAWQRRFQRLDLVLEEERRKGAAS